VAHGNVGRVAQFPPGDNNLIAAWSVDRLGRSLTHLLSFLEELNAKRVDPYLHQQGLDTSTAAGRALFQMCGVFAEFERSMIRERVTASLAGARKEGTRSGKPIGRPRNSSERTARQGLAMRRQGKGLVNIGGELHIGTGTVQPIIAERGSRQASAVPAKAETLNRPKRRVS